MAHIIVQLADDLTWEQFLARIQPAPVRGGAPLLVPVGGGLRTVSLVARRFACGELRMIGCEPQTDRWYYREER
jgi:hypothetical protein